MSAKTIHIPIISDWPCPEEVEFNINHRHDVSTAGVITQIDVLDKMAQLRNEVKTIMLDVEADPKLKKAFQSLFVNKKDFAKLSQFVDETRKISELSL